MKFYSTIIFLSVSLFGCILNKEKKEAPTQSIQNITFEMLTLGDRCTYTFTNDSLKQVRILRPSYRYDSLEIHYPAVNALVQFCSKSELEKFPLWTNELDSGLIYTIAPNEFSSSNPYVYNNVYFKYKLTSDTNYRYVPDGACKKFLYHTIDSIWVAHKGKITNKAD